MLAEESGVALIQNQSGKVLVFSAPTEKSKTSPYASLS